MAVVECGTFRLEVVHSDDFTSSDISERLQKNIQKMPLSKKSWLIPYSSANRSMQGPLSKFTISMVLSFSEVWLSKFSANLYYLVDSPPNVSSPSGMIRNFYW